jgi:hypothetical protein
MSRAQATITASFGARSISPLNKSKIVVVNNTLFDLALDRVQTFFVLIFPSRKMTVIVSH